MNFKLLITGIISIAVLLTAGIVASDEGWKERGKASWKKSRLDVAPVTNTLYAEECGDCHFAYQPGLLPARSWNSIMDTLEDHFGESAELEKGDGKAVRRYLLTNSADDSDYKRSRKILASLDSNDAPRRITSVRYFRRKHHELPEDIVRRDKELSSMSNCPACHRRAETGSYEEDEISIPGIGRWED